MIPQKWSAKDTPKHSSICVTSAILPAYTVTGEMDGGTGAGAHMWNIVEQDGRYYLADITNSDDGTQQERTEELFLNTPA